MTTDRALLQQGGCDPEWESGMHEKGLQPMRRSAVEGRQNDNRWDEEKKNDEHITSCRGWLIGIIHHGVRRRLCSPEVVLHIVGIRAGQEKKEYYVIYTSTWYTYVTVPDMWAPTLRARRYPGTVD